MNTYAPKPDLVTDADVELLREVPARYHQLADALDQRIIGQEEIIRDLFVALAVQGHVLMIGVPGLAKTLLVRSLAELLDLPFQRIQFTPDLMPSDITGTEIIEEADDGRRQFRFVRGPVFASLILADEINRTPPKTQAALLEAMQERRVTVAGRSYDLPSPFFVLATQNPIEQEGTYPLPEAQLDRFMFNLRVNYPSHDEEVRILLETTGDEARAAGKNLDAARNCSRCSAPSARCRSPESVADYAVSLVQATRPETAPRPISSSVMCNGAPARAPRNTSRSPEKFSPCSTAGSTWRAKTSSAPPNSCCATASSPITAPRPTSRPWTR